MGQMEVQFKTFNLSHGLLARLYPIRKWESEMHFVVKSPDPSVWELPWLGGDDVKQNV